MKLLLLHGVGIASSRQKLTAIKKDFDPNDVLTFDAGAAVEDIKNNLSNTPLFANDRLVVLENPPEDFIYELSVNYQLVLWFDHQLNEKKPTLEWVKKNKGEILYFPEEKEVSVFPFLDSLGNKDKKAYLKLAQLKRAGLDTQYIITMVFYLLRTLTVINKNTPQFVKEKLAKQRQNFLSSDLVNLYKFVLEIDFKIKSGFLKEEMAEFLLLNRFLSS